MSKADNQQSKKTFAGGLRWKKKQTVCTFVVDAAGIDSTVEELRELLLSSGYERKNALRLSFALDALLFDWYESGLENTPAELYIEKVLGQKKIVVEVRGKIEDAGQEESSQSYPWMEGLKENGLIWSSSHTAGGMRAELAMPKKGISPGVKFLIAIAAAVVTVLALSALPGDVIATANETVFIPLFDIGVGLLTALIGPMVFLSIIAGIIGAGDIDVFKRLGSRVLVRVMQANVLGLVVATIGAVVILGASFSLFGGAANFGKELLDPLFAIIPTSFFQPFIDGNVLQITVWAIVFGVGAILLKSRIPVLSKAIIELNSLVQWVMAAVAEIMPVFIYLAVIRLLSTISGETIVMLLRFFIVMVLAIVLITGILIVFAARRRKIGIATIVKTIMPVLTTAFLTSSTAASFPLMCETMKKLSVEESVVSFHAPIAVSLLHPMCILAYMLVIATAACLGGYTIGATQLVYMMVLCFVLGVATPSVPGGDIAIYALLFSFMGFDTASLSLFIVIDPIIDMICTPVNVTAIMTSGLHVDSDLKESDVLSE